MKTIPFLVFILCALSAASAARADGQSQTWRLRSGDNLDAIAATLDIPREEIKKHNPGIVETSLQVGQKLNLPLLSYAKSRALEADLRRKEERIAFLERHSGGLEGRLAAAESQLRWQPLWLWGFWLFFGVLAFLAAGAYWLFRQTHPQVFDDPERERSIRDLQESKIRARSFPYEEQGGNGGSGRWHPPLRRLPHGR